MNAELLFTLIKYSPLPSVCKLLWGGHTSIITLHRVLPDIDFKSPLSMLGVRKLFLDEFICKKRREGFRFISLDYLVDNYEECVYHGKNLIVTLDDGYKDNFEHAYPLFRRLEVPFTIYVTNSFPNGTANLWWYDIEGLNDKLSNYNKIRNRCLSGLVENNSAASRELCMNWEEIRIISNDDLGTIGCHTINHHNLTNLSELALIDEINHSRLELEIKTGNRVRHFCYPFGSENEVSTREVDIVKNLGFESAVTTIQGNLVYPDPRNIFSLPRIPLLDGRWKNRTDVYFSGLAYVLKKYLYFNKMRNCI
jgi:peptidoglycan/xylan/chitin deacetylase (PgdA/CDA1 family)